MYPKRPPFPAFGPRGTAWPFVSRVSSPTSFQTPANRLFAARTAAGTGAGPSPSCAGRSRAAVSALMPPMPITSAKTKARIRSPSARRGHRLERHDVDPLERVLPRQHDLHLHLVSRIRGALLRDAQK